MANKLSAQQQQQRFVYTINNLQNDVLEEHLTESGFLGVSISFSVTIMSVGDSALFFSFAAQIPTCCFLKFIYQKVSDSE